MVFFSFSGDRLVAKDEQTRRWMTPRNWNITLSYPESGRFGYNVTYVEVFVNRVIKFISFAKRKLMRKPFIFSDYVVNGKHTYYQWRHRQTSSQDQHSSESLLLSWLQFQNLRSLKKLIAQQMC